MSMDVLFRCNMDAVLRQIFLWLDPESLKRARQVCQQWEQFILERVWARMETRLVRNWLSGKPSMVVEEYRVPGPLVWRVIAMDTQLVVVWSEQEGPRVLERNSGRILATISKLPDKNFHSVGISDHFILVKNDHSHMVSVFTRPAIETSQDAYADGTSPPELTLLGSIDLKPHRKYYGSDDDDSMEDDNDEGKTEDRKDYDDFWDFAMDMDGEVAYDKNYDYSSTYLTGLGKSHVVTGCSFAPSFPTMVWKLEKGKFILAKTFSTQANYKPNFAVDGGRLLVVEHKAQPGIVWNDKRKRSCSIHDSRCITHGWLRIFNVDNLDKEEFLVDTDLAYLGITAYGDSVETLAFKFPLVAVNETEQLNGFVKVWNVETGLKLIHFDAKACFNVGPFWREIWQLHFVKNLLVIQLHDEGSDSIQLGVIDTGTSDEKPVATVRVFDQIIGCYRKKLWFDDTSVSYFGNGYLSNNEQLHRDPKNISTLNFWC